VQLVTSPLLSLSGAFPADPPDEGVAAHYGDPFREQRRFVDGEGAVDLSHRPIVRVSGPDRLPWLHSLTSQHLEALAPGAATEALILSPHGHIEHHLSLLDDGDATWMHVEPGTAESLIGYLEYMRFWSKVEVEEVSASYALVHTPTSCTTSPAGLLRRETAFGVDIFVSRADLESIVTAPGDPVGIWALEALRIAAGRPRLGFETDHRTLPHEVGWLEAAVHLNKGCYRGQETVARVHNLGRPPRRLVLLHLDGSDSVLPERGSPVTVEGREIGRVTSSARHYELGPVALGVVKRSTPVDAVLDVGGVPASQEILVPA
jgi:tRNA-modifying protein YgfZ